MDGGLADVAAAKTTECCIEATMIVGCVFLAFTSFILQRYLDAEHGQFDGDFEVRSYGSCHDFTGCPRP
jgi:hypothetical protein